MTSLLSPLGGITEESTENLIDDVLVDYLCAKVHKVCVSMCMSERERVGGVGGAREGRHYHISKERNIWQLHAKNLTNVKNLTKCIHPKL